MYSQNNNKKEKNVLIKNILIGDNFLKDMNKSDLNQIQTIKYFYGEGGECIKGATQASLMLELSNV
jgi:hypothetical protein